MSTSLESSVGLVTIGRSALAFTRFANDSTTRHTELHPAVLVLLSLYFTRARKRQLVCVFGRLCFEFRRTHVRHWKLLFVRSRAARFRFRKTFCAFRVLSNIEALLKHSHIP